MTRIVYSMCVLFLMKLSGEVRCLSDNETDFGLFDTDYSADNSSNCTNDYCIPDKDYIGLIEEHILPTRYECVLIAMHVIVFAVGLVGNALVCVAVYSNPTMRTVTNYFIVNLAVADFMVILFCLPPTVIWDVTETWFMGTVLCKIVIYFQVSHLRLCTIVAFARSSSFLLYLVF